MILNTRMYEDVLENVTEGVRFVSQMGQTFFWNKGAEALTGFSRTEMVGALCEALHLVRDEGEESVCSFLCPLKWTKEENRIGDIMVYLRHCDGHLVPVIMNAIPLLDDRGNKIGIAEIFQAVSWEKKPSGSEGGYSQDTLVDQLTGLCNRKHAEHTLKGKVEEFKRYGTRFGMTLIDVDDLKQINNRYGHEAGDRILQVVSRSLSSTLRPFDTICRWDSDEFIIMAANIRNDQNLMNMANRLRLLVQESSLDHNGKKLKATVSVGAVIVRQDEDEEGIINRARSLMKQSKSLGKNIVTMGRDFIGTK
jgi:diguanylate cyclase (GGDEF)-like protein/PAS domain S-box-containing protein